MTHEHGKRFPFDKVAKLDAPERRALQPPGRTIDALDLAAGAVVADLGAGTGYFALPVARQLAELGDGAVLALDVEPRMLELLAGRAAEAELGELVRTVEVPGSGPLPLADGSVDRVLLANVAHELPDRAATFAELGRILRPGGFLLIVDWSPDGPFDHGPPADHRVDPATIDRELAASGFTRTHLQALYEGFFAIRAQIG